MKGLTHISVSCKDGLSLFGLILSLDATDAAMRRQVSTQQMRLPSKFGQLLASEEVTSPNTAMAVLHLRLALADHDSSSSDNFLQYYFGGKKRE